MGVEWDSHGIGCSGFVADSHLICSEVVWGWFGASVGFVLDSFGDSFWIRNGFVSDSPWNCFVLVLD